MLDTLYTEEIRSYVRSREWPDNLIYEIVEYKNYLALRLYRLNINELPVDSKLKLTPLVNDMMTNIRGKGIPIYLEVAAGNGQRV